MKFSSAEKMSDGDTKKSWTEILPVLFSLLVENADGIIDDTSLERILEWLKNVCKDQQQLQKLLQCGTVEFLGSEQVFSNAESCAFFLRLFGFLASRDEVFNSLLCISDRDFLARFLGKPRNEPKLWNEGIVRNGYFQALISLTKHKDGMLWLENTGHIGCALDCIVDRSIFVANSARNFIAKYAIHKCDLVLSTNPEETLQRILDDKNLAFITEKLMSKLSHESSTSIAVIEIMRILLFENSTTGQKFLQETRMLTECLHLMKVGDETVCRKLADVICEMAINTRTWALDWNNLICTEDLSVSNILLGSCLDLFKRGLTSTGLELIAGLSSCHGSSSAFLPNWLEVLFGVVEVLFELVFNPTCHNTGNSHNSNHFTGGENVTVGIVDGLMSDDKQHESSAKQQLQRILSAWIKENHSQMKVICQTLVSAKQLAEQASSRHCSHVLHWLKHSLDLVEHCVDSNKESTMELYGNHRVLKASLEFIASIAEVQMSRDLLEFKDLSAVDELFDDVVRVLLKIIENSDSSATAMSTSLKTLGKVLESARPEFVTKLFCSDTEKADTSRKRVRLDLDAACKNLQQVTTVQAVNRDKLAFALFRRLRDSRWEVRDSTLEFVSFLLLINNDSVYNFLCGHNIPAIVWNATDDSESFVRASALNVIGSFVCQSQVWSSLLQTGHVTEGSILEKLSYVIEKDDEAFPRRRAVECLTLLIQTRHPIAERVLRDVESSRLDKETMSRKTNSINELYTEEIQSSIDAQNLNDQTRPEVIEASSLFGIFRSVCHACQDFDWEVKLRGLEVWEAVIGFFAGMKSNKEGVNRGEAKSFYDESSCYDKSEGGCPKPAEGDELFQVLYDLGALKILSEAVDDCDHLVCVKAIDILAVLQSVANPEKSCIDQCVKTARDFQQSLGEDFDLKKFKSILQGTDFLALTQSSEAADSAVRSDPVSLIEDILVAASHGDENLLDCY